MEKDYKLKSEKPIHPRPEGHGILGQNLDNITKDDIQKCFDDAKKLIKDK